MSEMTTIARPYAKAAFDFAVEKGALDQWSEMLSFAAEVARNDVMADLLGGAIAADTISDTFIDVCGEQLNDPGKNFIRVLADNGRLKALPDVLSLFLALRHEHDKQVDVDVISAVELSEEQLQTISSKLEKRLERKVKLSTSVDDALVAGVIIRAGDTVIDNSVRGRINRLSDALQS